MRDSTQPDGDLHAVAPGDFVDSAESAGRSRLAGALPIVLWGTIAASALGIAAFSAWSGTGSQRLQAMLAPAASQPATVDSPAEPPVPSPTEQPLAVSDDRHGTGDSAAEEIRQLKERLHALSGEWAGDRTRILARLEAVERGMDVVASISRQQSVSDRSGVLRQETPVDTAAAARPRHPQFAVDLGPAPSIDALRRLWATVSSQHGAVLHGLHPLAAVTDDRRTGRAEIRLVAGPLPSATTAASACAVIGSTGRACRPARFEGQRIALQ